MEWTLFRKDNFRYHQLLPLMRVVLALFCVLLISCKGYEPLSRSKVPFEADSIRLDGYYYCIGKEFSNGYHDDYMECVFLNANGTYHKVMYGTIDMNLSLKETLLNYDKAITDYTHNRTYTNSRPNWGVFEVNGSSIAIESWTFASGGGAYPTQTLMGSIINDTTLHFNTLIGAYPNNKGGKKKVKTIDDTYHFRHYSPKPDSINTSIK